MCSWIELRPRVSVDFAHSVAKLPPVRIVHTRHTLGVRKTLWRFGAPSARRTRDGVHFHPFSALLRRRRRWWQRRRWWRRRWRRAARRPTVGRTSAAECACLHAARRVVAIHKPSRKAHTAAPGSLRELHEVADTVKVAAPEAALTLRDLLVLGAESGASLLLARSDRLGLAAVRVGRGVRPGVCIAGVLRNDAEVVGRGGGEGESQHGASADVVGRRVSFSRRPVSAPEGGHRRGSRKLDLPAATPP